LEVLLSGLGWSSVVEHSLSRPESLGSILKERKTRMYVSHTYAYINVYAHLFLKYYQQLRRKYRSLLPPLHPHPQTLTPSPFGGFFSDNFIKVFIRFISYFSNQSAMIFKSSCSFLYFSF
jgi:hypothetical protein